MGAPESTSPLASADAVTSDDAHAASPGAPDDSPVRASADDTAGAPAATADDTADDTAATADDAADDAADDMVITVSERAVAHLTAIRDEEPEGNRLGLRLEILSDEGQDFTYDLSFQVVTKADITDVVRNHGGLRVVIPARDAANLEGAVLDLEGDGLVLRNPNRPKPLRLDGLVRDDDLAARISAVIDTEVNPALDAHGGYVTLVGHDGNGRAYLTMGGGCHGCAMSRMTMLQGVQTMVKDTVPEIDKVIDVTDHSTGENPYYT